jgi:hypothetical protein
LPKTPVVRRRRGCRRQNDDYDAAVNDPHECKYRIKHTLTPLNRTTTHQLLAMGDALRVDMDMLCDERTDAVSCPTQL